MKQATYRRHELIFKRPGGTSRGVLKTKETFFLEVTENGKTGLGECAVFRGLSYDDTPEYEEKLQWLCDPINEEKEQLETALKEYPSIWFGYEQALLNLKHGSDLYFPSAFTTGEAFIKINGLIWMGNAAFMQEQIQEKLQLGFDCIKLKIGVNWREERNILTQLRAQFPEAQLEL
ncbi:MAG TPA: o-succinylbenzoate synthase, partial [Chryseobacterium sp.]|nr:o-succinylbenzoate synthase [Chryseobacterium sp.]